MQAERTERVSAIEKVRKMLALAAENSGATEAERDVAMKRAQEFMFKHGLEMLEVEAEAGDGPEFVEDSDRIEGQAHFWKGRLYGLIGRSADVHVHIQSRGRTIRTYVLVGRQDAIAFVRELAAYLIPYLEMECEAALRKALADGEQVECSRCRGDGVLYGGRTIGNFAPHYCPSCDGTGSKLVTTRTFRRNFYESAGYAISNRLADQRRKMEKEAGATGMELVRSDRTALKQHIADAYPNLRTVGRRDGSFSPSADAAGRRAGNSADLSGSAKLRGGQRTIGDGR